MRILVAFGLATALVVSSFSVCAQNNDPKTELRGKLLAQFTLTKLNDDRSEIVAAGTPVLLHKGGVGITPTSITPPEKSTYKNGKVSMGFFEKDRAIHNTSVASDSQLKALLLKEGAKVWVSAILVEDDGVIFRLNTGKINDALYYGNLVFPFPNGATPPVDDVLKTIAEVVTPIKAVNPGLTNMLRETFVLTTLTSDQSDIAKPGSVLVLHKDGLVLYPLSVGILPVDVYKNGKITLGPGSGLMETAKWDSDGSAPGVTRLPMNSGDKFWVADIRVQDHGVSFGFITDEIKGHRYVCYLFFPYPKGDPLQPEEFLKTVSEVVTVDSGDESSAGSAAPSSAPPSPIAPPPPPADAPPPQPKTIAIGMTKDMVVAIMGQPQKIIDLGAKEIHVYPDIKVTYVNGKVNDVQ